MKIKAVLVSLGYHDKKHRLGHLNYRNECFQSSGGWKSKIEVSAGLLLLRVVKENLFHVSVLASCFSIVPWLVHALCLRLMSFCSLFTKTLD